MKRLLNHLVEHPEKMFWWGRLVLSALFFFMLWLLYQAFTDGTNPASPWWQKIIDGLMLIWDGYFGQKAIDGVCMASLALQDLREDRA